MSDDKCYGCDSRFIHGWWCPKCHWTAKDSNFARRCNEIMEGGQQKYLWFTLYVICGVALVAVVVLFAMR